MDPSRSITVQIILILAVVLMNAFLTAAEVALEEINLNKLSDLVEEGDRKAILLNKAVENEVYFIGAIQSVTTFTGLLAATWITMEMADDVSGYLMQYGVPYSYQIAIIVIALIATYVVLVIGRFVPKYIARQNPEGVALKMIRPIGFIAKIMSPFVSVVAFSTNVLIKLFRLEAAEKEEVSEEDIKDLIIKGEESGVINETAKEMIYGVFEFGDKVATEVMIPRLEVIMINKEYSKEKVLEKVLEHKFSRMPVYEEHKHNIVGILQTKDFLEAVLQQGIENIDLEELIKPAYFVPETKGVETLFKELKKSKNHMAILIDEYGDFSGIVTIEDIIEEIVGDLIVESDKEDQEICQIDESTYMVDGLTHIDDINKYFDLDIECENFDTIGGFVVNLLGNIPKQKVATNYKDIIFEVDRVKSNRVEKLKIYMPKEIAV